MTSRDLTPLLPIAAATSSARGRRTFSDWGYVLAFGAVGWPWLLRSLSGGGETAHAALLARLELPREALPNVGSWKADAGFLHLIVDHIEATRPQLVVEFGSGGSTLITARALQKNGGGRLVSFDQHPEFARSTAEWLRSYGLHADVRGVPLVPSPGDWPGVWYDHGVIADPIDLLIIDGPPWTIHPYVRGAAEVLFPRLAAGGTILLDDGARPGERVVARRWRERWPGCGFELRKSGPKGTLVGKRGNGAVMAMAGKES